MSVEYIQGSVGRDNFWLAAGGDYIGWLNGVATVSFIEGGTGYLAGATQTGDQFHGAPGTGHFVSYRTSSAAVDIDLNRGLQSGGDAEGDNFTGNISNIEGSAHADTLTGDDGANIFIGGAGADIIDGGGGTDTVSYANAPATNQANFWGVQVDLSLGEGAVQAESLSRPASGGTITFFNGHARGDRLTSIENIIGSDWRDVLTGNDQENILWGGGRSDTLDGRGGDDLLYGGDGDDTLHSSDTGSNTLDGGAGTDTVSYERLTENTTPYEWRPHQLPHWPDNAGWPRGGEAYDGTNEDFIGINGIRADLAEGIVWKVHGPTGVSDTGITGIENITGSAFDDAIAGDDAGNTLTGGDGDDYLYGRGGDDTLDGGTGDDALYGGTGDDSLRGGAGADWLEGGAGDDTLVGGAGGDVLDGGAGVGDLADYSAETAALHIRLGTMVVDSVASPLSVAHQVPNTSNTDIYIVLQQDGTISAVADFTGLTSGEYVVLAELDSAGAFVWQRTAGTQALFVGTANADGSNIDITLNGNVNAVALLAEWQDTGISYSGLGGAAQGDVLSGIEHLTGGDGADTLVGDREGNHLTGGAGADTLIGGDGADRLDGGAGRDTLTGGLGADVFVLDPVHAVMAAADADTITDLDAGDRIDIGNLSVLRWVADGSDLLLQTEDDRYLARLQGDNIIPRGTDLADILSVDRFITSADSLIFTFTVAATAGADSWSVAMPLSEDRFDFASAGRITGFSPADDRLDIGAADEVYVLLRGGHQYVLNSDFQVLVRLDGLATPLTDAVFTSTAGAVTVRPVELGDLTPVVDATSGNDGTTAGTSGDDLMFSLGGTDTFNGGAGDDTWLLQPVDSGYGGANTVDGGAGTDTADYSYITASENAGDGWWTTAAANNRDGQDRNGLWMNANTKVFNKGDTGTADTLDNIEILIATGLNDWFDQDNSAGNIETFWLGAGHDFIWAGNKNNTIYGQDGNDDLRAETGDDILLGGLGNDRLDGRPVPIPLPMRILALM